jgi:hypothetical protein
VLVVFIGPESFMMDGSAPEATPAP